MIRPIDGVNGWEIIGKTVDWELYYNRYELEYKLIDLMTDDSIRMTNFDDTDQLIELMNDMKRHERSLHDN